MLATRLLCGYVLTARREQCKKTRKSNTLQQHFMKLLTFRASLLILRVFVGCAGEDSPSEWELQRRRCGMEDGAAAAEWEVLHHHVVEDVFAAGQRRSAQSVWRFASAF